MEWVEGRRYWRPVLVPYRIGGSVALCTCSVAEDVTTEDLFNKCEQFMINGSLEEALNAYDQAIELDLRTPKHGGCIPRYSPMATEDPTEIRSVQ